VTPEEIIAFCLERIASSKCRRYIEYVKEFPKSASDKIQKNVLVSRKADLTEAATTGSGSVNRKTAHNPGAHMNSPPQDSRMQNSRRKSCAAKVAPQRAAV